MTAALEVLVLSGLAAALGWGAALVGPESWRPAAADGAATLREAFRESSVRDGLGRRAREAAERAGGGLPPVLPAGARRRLLDGLAVAFLQARILAEALPVLAAGVSAAAAFGLFRREGRRSGLSFASPLRAHLGKQLAIVGASALLGFALVPLPLPPGAVWWGGGGAAAGVALWVANLPLKV